MKITYGVVQTKEIEIFPPRSMTRLKWNLKYAAILTACSIFAFASFVAFLEKITFGHFVMFAFLCAIPAYGLFSTWDEWKNGVGWTSVKRDIDASLTPSQRETIKEACDAALADGCGSICLNFAREPNELEITRLSESYAGAVSNGDGKVFSIVQKAVEYGYAKGFADANNKGRDE